MVDIHQPGDYPIILGDSLKDDAPPSSAHISLRYNWIPRSGLTGNHGKVKATQDGLSLAYNRDGETLKYTGWLSEQSQADQTPQLALFYDASKSAFVVEKLAAVLDFNLHAGTNITPDHINRHSQIPNPGSSSADSAKASHPDEHNDDAQPDDSNPFDYRHFLAEAKENAEKNNLAGSRTPLAGGFTPMSGLSSPMGASHFLQPTTPQFGPIEIIDATHIEDGPDWGDRRHHFKSANKAKAARKTKSNVSRTNAKTSPTTTRKTQSQIMPLSSERVQDSSDSDSDADSDVQPASLAPPSVSVASKQTKKTNPTKKKIPPPTRSPAIVIDKNSDSDSDSGGLEIESGSPPPTLRKQGYKIDADAFRSQTGTPAVTRPVSRQSNDADADIHMPDADDAEDVDEDDTYNKYLASASDDDSDRESSNIRANRRRKSANADVDDLILDDGHTSSPEPAPPPSKSKSTSHTKKSDTQPLTTMAAPIPQRASKRRQSSTISRASRTSRVQPSRKNTEASAALGSPEPMLDSDDDDDGGLAAELEAAIAREQQYGLGIGMDVDGEGESDGAGDGGQGRVDEESDISEEE